MPVFATPEPIYVRLDLSVGDVRIIASDRADTVVEVHPASPAKRHDVEAAERTTVDFTGDRLAVRVPAAKFGLFGRTNSVRLTVEVPTGSAVHANAQLATFRTEGELGDCRFAAGGEIRLDRTGALWLDCNLGDVAAEHVGGAAEVTAGMGEVRIREIAGDAVIRNSSGGCWLGRVGGEARLNTSSGHITVDRADAGVEAKTAYGNIRIGQVRRGSVELETSYGEIDVGIRSGVAAWLDVSSGYGKIRSELDEADEPVAESADTVEIRAHSAYGNIKLSRSAG